VVFKREILWYPGIGWCMWLSRYLSVDRRDRESGKALLRDAAATLRGGKDVLFFPEGTRQTDAAAGALGPFKPGAFKLACDTGAAVLPIAMSGARQLMPMARGFPRLRCGTVRLRIFPAIPSAGKTVEQLSDACRAAIEGGLRDCDVVLASASSSKKILPDKQG
jgi:1-acyl-sn-glycerol-3-phosphate acyltransferase